MNPFQVFASGLKQSLRRPLSAIATVVILIVPTLYPLIWLQAFWDPYGNVDHLPIAFVNEDTGSAGAGIEENLQASTDVDWQFPDRADADSGLSDATYYAEFVIPAGFSQAIAAATPATIEVFTDSKNNFTASLLITQIEQRLQTSLSQTFASSTLAKVLPGQTSLAGFITEPVSISATDINPVANMGMGSAPYFCSLALWIGALVTALVMGRRVDPARLPATSGASIATGQFLLYGLVGLVQAGLLSAVLYGLGVDVHHGIATYLCLALTALMSMAVVHFLIAVFGMLGQMLSMILLILQLTASGGTFPVQLTQGGFFAAIHPYMPFTYSVTGLRETISASTMDTTRLGPSLLILAGIMLVALALTVVLTHLKLRRQARSQPASVPLPQS